MTLRMILGWWRSDLVAWWQARQRERHPTVASFTRREGRMCKFMVAGTVMYRSAFTVHSRRGGMYLGRIEWRNQWGYYAFHPATDGVMFNMEILAEIYAMLKELGGDRPQAQ